MKRIFSSSIFVRILLATLLPLILIFSIVIVTITRSVFRASAGAAQEKTLSFSQQSAEQVRGSFIRASGLTELTAKDLALVAEDSDSAREAALQIVKHTLENAPNAYRIRMYFPPGENAFGTGDVFAHVFYNEDGEVVGYPYSLDDDPDLDLDSPWYTIPLKEGVPYHDSVSHGRFGLNRGPTYAASTNYPVIKNGKVVGSVGMGLLYRRSFQFVDQWEADGSYRLLIVSDKGTVLYASNTALIDQNVDSLGFETKFLGDMQQAMDENKSFMAESFSPLFRQESLICIYPVDLPQTTTRVFMYMDTPTELVYANANASVRTVLLTFLAGLALFIGSLFAVTKKIVTPIKELRENANRIANGQLDVILGDFGENGDNHDEIHSLGASLQKMLKGLTSNHELKLIAVQAEYEKTRMEETAATKDRFFANMSHEIRTPMNVILGMAEVLQSDDLTAEQRKHVNNIKISSESLLDIINDILDLSRLESGNLPLLPIHYDLKVLLDNVRSLSQYLAERKGLTFRLETTGDIPDVLYGDDARLRQILLNIVGNGIKFTERGGVILAVADKGDTLQFDVVDTGIGIRQEDVSALFDPFRQIDSPLLRRTKGSGLGLSISRNLVELMGGAITVDSEVGEGSIFHIVIPKVAGDRNLIEKTTDMLPVAFDSGARILVVDDSDINLNVAQELLKLFGIAADTALSGAEAIGKLSGSEYDLVFMDHMMPEMDGVEATRRIRAMGGRLAKMPIVALTANAVNGSRELFLSSGMNDFLPKPIEKLRLQAILAKWMPDNLVLREDRYGSGSRFRFRSTLSPRSNASDPDQSSNILAKAAELEELDIPLGLSHVAGNRELYEKMLGMIVESIHKALGKIGMARTTGDTKTLKAEFHKLKGNLANMGATDLAVQAAELSEREQPDGDGERFATAIDRLCQALESFAGKLHDILSSRREAAHRITPEEGRKLETGLNKLHKSLMEFSFTASMEIITNLLLFDWGEEYNRGLEAIHSHIEHFDYDAAITELEQVFSDMA